MKHILTPSCWLLAVLALLLAGCVTRATPPPTPTSLTSEPVPFPTFPPVEGVDVSFETIALNESDTNILAEARKPEPQLLLLTSAQDTTAIQNQVNPETWPLLQGVGFDKYAIVTLFQGIQPSSNYRAVIQRITRQDNRLIVDAQFWQPNPYWASTTAETYPYHLVKVSKDDLPAGKVELVLQIVVLTPVPPAP
ncbi:MAG: protease complex subunit PrcB family protein [Caldilineaceae bacterium]|nr:protease complex subunit PrcB family protein [Caldilineaceae bacterium]MBP8107933.1 protease complex subunit PrcB family protein [Caldilineaceae bacterium]MBP8122999.1 protease complex subunit PrcB family protein [Caldilineaceae bacterium]MBP9073006.1 protease complex subunit PrcB family protein [Caldilineaceae bacterium]